MEQLGLEHFAVQVADDLRHRFYGKYRGVVVDNKDPKELGRITANVPEVLDGKTSPWALPCVALSGPNEGEYFIPPKGAGVWIEFEAGDPARPIWSGCWWKKDQLPKTTEKKAPKPSQKILKSESGLMVAMDDDGKTLEVSDIDGKNFLKLEVTSGQVTLKAKSKVVVEAPKIELVDKSTHPLVFGDDLLRYLNQLVAMLQTHTHPGELAAGFIPVTPMVPGVSFPTPSSSMLSTKVTTG